MADLRSLIARIVVVVLVAPAVAVAVTASAAHAAVTINVPANQPTIQAGINAASSGDTVVVAPGTYHEHINFIGKAVEVKSSAGPATTIIDGDNSGTVVTFNTSETSSSILRGFTIQHGAIAGIETSGTSPTITENFVTNNVNNGFSGNGGGIETNAGNPTITHNALSHNAACTGGGMSVSGDALIQDNTFDSNMANCPPNPSGIALWSATGATQVTGNTFTGNLGGPAVQLFGGSGVLLRNNVIAHTDGFGLRGINADNLTVVQNVIVGNKLGIDGEFATTGWTLTNNTVADNTANVVGSLGTTLFGGPWSGRTFANNIFADGLDCNTSGAPPTLTTNNISSALHDCAGSITATANTSANPHFLDAPSGNYRLQTASPSLDVGSNGAPSLPATDLDGHTRIQNGTVDQGAYEFTAPPTTPTGEFTALTPARLLETRSGFTTIDHLFEGGGPVGQDSSIDVQITGRGGVPATGQVSAVVLNATVTGSNDNSYLTVWPTGVARPTISNLNFGPGQTVPNLVTVAVGSGGKVSVYNNRGSVHAILDVVGYYSTATGPFGSRFHGVTPFRDFDTRNGTGGVPIAKVGQGATLKFNVLGKGGVAASGVTGLVMNVTSTEASAGSFVTVSPDDAPRPNASNLNFGPGQTIPNLVTVRVPASGIVDFYNALGATHLIADVVGYYDGVKTTEGGRFVAVTPFRKIDTRTIPFKIGPGGFLIVRFPGFQGLPPAGIGSMVMNVTVTEPDSFSFVTVFPPDLPPPLASNLNFDAGQTVPNLAITRTSNGPVINSGPTTPGWVGYFNKLGNTHLIVDVFGYFTASFTDVDGAEVDATAADGAASAPKGSPEVILMGG